MDVARRSVLPPSNSTPHKPKSWHNSLPSTTGDANHNGGSNFTPPAWESTPPQYSTTSTPTATASGNLVPRTDSQRGSLMNVSSFDSDSDSDAPAYVILGACRRQVAPGTSLQDLWNSIPSLEVQAGTRGTLCVCTSRSAPSCKHTVSAPSNIPSPARNISTASFSSSGGSGKDRGTMEGQNSNQAHAQAYHMRRAAETMRQLWEVQKQGTANGTLALPMLMGRVERESGRAEIAFRPEHVILPGVTYRAFAPRCRAEGEGGVQGPGLGSAARTGGLGTRGEAMTPVEQEALSSEGKARELKKCNLSFPDGSRISFPAGITLLQATERLVRSEYEGPKSGLRNASFGSLLPSAAGVAAILLAHYKTVPGQVPLPHSLSSHSSSKGTSALLASTKSSKELVTLQLRPSQNSSASPLAQSGEHHPMLLLARTANGCRVLIRPHDMLEAGIEYQVKVRVPYGLKSNSGDTTQAQGEMNKSAGERWSHQLQKPAHQGAERFSKENQQGRLPGASTRAKAPNPASQTGSQVPQGHYRSLWGSSTKILARSNSRDASPMSQHTSRGPSPADTSRRGGAQLAPDADMDPLYRPMTAPGGGPQRPVVGSYLSRPGGASQPSGLSSLGSSRGAGGLRTGHVRSASSLAVMAVKQEEKTAGSTMFDGALKTFSNWWQK